jgi:hypothetical protein
VARKLIGPALTSSWRVIMQLLHGRSSCEAADCHFVFHGSPISEACGVIEENSTVAKIYAS